MKVGNTIYDIWCVSLLLNLGQSYLFIFKVVSILSEWSNTGKAQLADFENDPRFLRLCRILIKNNSTPKSIKITHTGNSDDLAVVLSVTADDEAAQLIGGITVPQMVKVSSIFIQVLYPFVFKFMYLLFT